ncbi:MAG: hypothetical protein SO009_01850, partial [Bacilli bacterium]|nr:hypothetical protein [Bacilli bacterium]
NDKSTVKDVTVNSVFSENGVLNKESTPFPGLGYQKEKTAYGSTIRNAGIEQSGEENSTYGTGPSLICPKDNDGGKLSKFTVDDTVNGNGNLDYKIGLLTIDEMILAGLATFPMFMNNNYGENYVTSYLRANSSADYWSLSPSLSSDSEFIWEYESAVAWSLVNGYAGDTRNVRPVIALKSATTISGGNGTASSPFVIN